MVASSPHLTSWQLPSCPHHNSSRLPTCFHAAAVNTAGGIVPWSIAQLMVACLPGAPGAHAHCPVEVWD